MEAIRRYKAASGFARDDEGNLLEGSSDGTDLLAVAHILPHALTRINEGGELVCAYTPPPQRSSGR